MKLLTRPRRIAVALFALGGSVAGAGVLTESASAECFGARVWVYYSELGRDYLVNDPCVTETPFPTHTDVTLYQEFDEPFPEGIPSGGGVETELTDF